MASGDLQSSFSWLAKGAGDEGDCRNAIEAVTASIAAAYLFVPPLVDELMSDSARASDSADPRLNNSSRYSSAGRCVAAMRLFRLPF